MPVLSDFDAGKSMHGVHTCLERNCSRDPLTNQAISAKWKIHELLVTCIVESIEDLCEPSGG